MSDSIPSFPIYWEQQVAALCGTHAINNLLQGPYYSEVDMANIAQSIDARERALMLESGADSADYLSFVAQDSSNVDASGNFSISVISECLRNFGLDCCNLQSKECESIRQAPQEADAFICNQQSHWLALRRINGLWFNLNSLQKDNCGWGPTWVSDLYLDTLIRQLQAARYTVYVVQGRLPPVDASQEVGPGAAWFDSREVVEMTRNPSRLPPENRPKPIRSSHWPRDPDADLAAALAASMQQGKMGGSRRWPPPEQRTSGGSAAAASAFVDDEDEDMRRALELSMQEMQQPATGAAASSTAAASPAAAAAAAVSSSAASTADSLPAVAEAASHLAATSMPPAPAPATSADSSHAADAVTLPLADDAMDQDEDEQLRRAIEMSMQQQEQAPTE